MAQVMLFGLTCALGSKCLLYEYLHEAEEEQSMHGRAMVLRARLPQTLSSKRTHSLVREHILPAHEA